MAGTGHNRPATGFSHRFRHYHGAFGVINDCPGLAGKTGFGYQHHNRIIINCLAGFVHKTHPVTVAVKANPQRGAVKTHGLAEGYQVFRQRRIRGMVGKASVGHTVEGDYLIPQALKQFRGYGCRCPIASIKHDFQAAGPGFAGSVRNIISNNRPLHYRTRPLGPDIFGHQLPDLGHIGFTDRLRAENQLKTIIGGRIM